MSDGWKTLPTSTGTYLTTPSSGYNLPAPSADTQLVLEVHGRELTLAVAARDRPVVRQRLREIGRQEKAFAARAGNAANTAQQIGIGVGAALAVGGGIALATVAAPIALGAVVLTGAGILIATGGMIASHVFTGRRIEHEQRMDRFMDAAEELK